MMTAGEFQKWLNVFHVLRGIGPLIFQGTWNANTNSPTLVSSTGTAGSVYIVSVAGSTNLNGITDWQVGDWATFNGTVWQKVDNTNANVVVGPASATDNALTRFDGTTGKLIQNGTILQDDSGNLTGVGTINTVDVIATLNTISTAISNINDQITSLQSAVMGLGTTLANTNTALETPQTGVLYAATNGQIGAAGTETYPYPYPSAVLDAVPPITPTVLNPWVVKTAPGYYDDPALPFQLIPSLSFSGDETSPPQLELIATGSFTLGDWTAGGEATIENFEIINGGIDLDFFTPSYSAASTINFKNITTSASGLVRVLGIDSSVTSVNVENLNTTVIDPIFDAVNLTVKNGKLTGLLVSSNNGNSVAVIDSLETTANGIYLQSTVGTVTAQIENSPNNPSIAIDGGNVGLAVDNISLAAIGGAANITYINGATPDQVTFLDRVLLPYDVVQISSDVALVGAVFGRYIRFTNTIPITVTLPQQSTWPTHLGTLVKGTNIGSAVVTFVTEGADSSTGNPDMIMAPGTSVEIVRTSSTNWNINGGSAFFIGTVFANIAAVADGTFCVDPYFPVPAKFANMITICQSGTATAAFDIDGTPMGASPNAVSSARDFEGASSANETALGSQLNVTFTDTAACVNAVVGGSFFYMGNY